MPFRELHGLFQEQENTKRLSFSTFLFIAPCAKKATTTSLEQMFFNTVHLHGHDPRDKLEK